MVTTELAKRSLAIHGEVRSQPALDWQGTFRLPLAVERFYSDVGPVNIWIETHGNPFFLPCLVDLWQFQAGYRWNGLNGEPIEDWCNEWLVVADEGGDPFIFDCTSEVVLHAYHGQGAWDAKEIFPSLNSMAACLGELGAIVTNAGDDFWQEDCSIRPNYRALASTRLEDLLGAGSEAESILDSLGWA